MNNPKLSIIIPAYNLESYINKTLDSVLNQEFKDFEIIIVNDGSKDKTPQIIDEYAKKYECIKTIHKENGGVSSARLAGLAIAKGEYIGFVDGDDTLDSTMYSLLIKNAIENNADISHCGYKMVFPDGREDLYYNTNKKLLQDNETGLVDLISGEFVEPGLWNKIYRKSIIENAFNKNTMNTTIKYNEDLLMNYYFFKESKISVYEDKCLYNYIVHKGSAANSKLNSNKLRDPLLVKKIIKEDIANQSDRIIQANDKKLAYLLLNLAVMKDKNNMDIITPYKKNAKKELREMIKYIITNKFFGKKLQIMCFLACYMPGFYYILHKIYARITGSDKKYHID